jgi:hypothetical protein
MSFTGSPASTRFYAASFHRDFRHVHLQDPTIAAGDHYPPGSIRESQPKPASEPPWILALTHLAAKVRSLTEIDKAASPTSSIPPSRGAIPLRYQFPQRLSPKIRLTTRTRSHHKGYRPITGTRGYKELTGLSTQRPSIIRPRGSHKADNCLPKQRSDSRKGVLAHPTEAVLTLAPDKRKSRPKRRHQRKQQSGTKEDLHHH